MYKVWGSYKKMTKECKLFHNWKYYKRGYAPTIYPHLLNEFVSKAIFLGHIQGFRLCNNCYKMQVKIYDYNVWLDLLCAVNYLKEKYVDEVGIFRMPYARYL